MELAWFRKPTADDEGTLNLAYNAVDLQVIRGRAAEPAVTGPVTLDFAGLLEQVGALAGAVRGLGVQPGHHVGAQLCDPHRELLVLLATARVGATFVALDEGSGNARLEEFRPHLVVADTVPEFTEHVPSAVIVTDGEPVDETRDLGWEIALKAGRTDPAGCADLTPRATAYVLERPVAIEDVAADPSRLGTILCTLAAGEPVHLDSGDCA